MERGRLLLLLLLLLVGLFLLPFQVDGISVGLKSKSLGRPSASQLRSLQEAIGYKFNNTDLLLDALTHASYSRHNNGPLHLLGNHIIQASIYLHSYAGNPDLSKEELENISVGLSNNKACARDALELGLDKLIMAGKHEEVKTAKVLSVALHALFGAIALDGNADEAMSVYWRGKQELVMRADT